MLRTLFSVSLLLSSFLLASVPVAGDDKIVLGDHIIERTVQLRTHSLYAPYVDQDLQSRWWDFGADAYINTNRHVRLTRNVPSQMGWLWSRLPLTAPNPVIEVEFKVSGDSTHLYGDGLALWITTERALPGPIFGSKDEFTGLGIFLDTYANARHSFSFPRITGVLGDGKTSFDTGDDAQSQSIGGCSINFRRTNVATKLKVTYVQDKLLDVKIQYSLLDNWTDCFQVKNISLPTNPYLGFSALTGDVSDAHDIIAVTTSAAVMAPTDARADTSTSSSIWRRSGGKKSTSGRGTLVSILLFAGVCAVGFYGYKAYRRRMAGVSLSGIGQHGSGLRSGPNGGYAGGSYKRY